MAYKILKGARAMSTDYGFKVDGWSSNWNGQNHSNSQARRGGRLNKLRALLEALKEGNVVNAQKAILDLWSFDASLKTDPYLIKINDELSKRQIYFAQKTAIVMQSDSSHFSKALFPSLSLADTARATQAQVKPSGLHEATMGTAGTAPKKATSGEFGRLIDVSA